MKLLIFHPTIAPYRIDFFNDLFKSFDTRICLQYRNLLDQKFDYDKIEAQFIFTPVYLQELFRLKGRVFNYGYWKQLDEFSPDIVIVGEFGWDAILVLLHRFLKRKKYKVVSICDDSYNMVAEGNDFSRLHRFLRSYIVPKLDELILVETKVTQWYQEHYGKGFFFPIIKNDDKARDEYATVLPRSREMVIKYGLTGKTVFLFVGRLVAIKNVDTVLKAFAKLKRPDRALVIVGDGPEKEKLEQLANNLEVDVLFTGRLEGEELLQWYNIATCFVLASYQEPFGAVTNEALLAGCHCLISSRAGSACLIEEGVNGWTFDPQNVEELKGKMEKVIDECKSTLAQQMKLRENKMPFRYDGKFKNLLHRFVSILK